MQHLHCFQFVAFCLECPRQFFAYSLYEHSAAYVGIANVLVNNLAIFVCHAYYIIKHMIGQHLLPAFTE